MPTSPESIALAKDLKRRGWTFVGPTTVYAFMQAMGLVNDHLHDCDTRKAVRDARARFSLPRKQRQGPLPSVERAPQRDSAEGS